jgi:nucleoside-diphosphate-sugar epimerase
MENKTVLITGAAGFIPSHLVDKFLAEGFFVIGVDNFITGRRVNIKHLENNSNFFFLEADVSLPAENYLDTFWDTLKIEHPEAAKIDYLLHFASPASPPAYQEHPIETYLVSSMGTHNLLTYVNNNFPEAKVVFASTSEVYGDPEVHPQTEDYWGNVNPNGPRSCYDEAKRMGETVCGVFERDFALDIRILRIFNTYGPRMRPDDGRILPNFINQALAKQKLTVYGDGKQTRSYCYVTDLVAGIYKLATIDGLKGTTVNLGNPDEYTVLETAVLVQKLINNEVGQENIVFESLPKDDPSRRKPNIEKAKTILGWQPMVDFRTGLAKTIEYFQNPESQILE